MTVMQHAIDESGGHDIVTKHFAPLLEILV